MAWFIYILCDPRVEDPILRVRYVGAAHDAVARLKTHINNRAKHHSHISCWLRLMIDKNKIKPIQEIIACGDEPWESKIWEEHERKWIAHYREIGCDLCNLTDGGECGKSYLPEVGAKISKALKTGDQSWRKKCSEWLKKAWADGTFKPKKYSPTAKQIENCTKTIKNISPEAKARGIAASVAKRSIPLEIVKIILELRDAKLSYSKIAKELQQRGLPTSRGGVWRMESVAYVCQNREKYKL